MDKISAAFISCGYVRASARAIKYMSSSMHDSYWMTCSGDLFLVSNHLRSATEVIKRARLKKANTTHFHPEYHTMLLNGAVRLQLSCGTIACERIYPLTPAQRRAILPLIKGKSFTGVSHNRRMTGSNLSYDPASFI